MIDYLEQLLEQAAEEEMEEFLWPQTKGRYAAAAESGEEKAAAEEGTPAAEGNGRRGEKQTQMEWEPFLAGMAARGDPRRQGRRQRSVTPDSALSEFARSGRQRMQERERRPATAMGQGRKSDLEKALSDLGRAVARGKNEHVMMPRKHRSANEVEAERRTAVREKNARQPEAQRGLMRRLDAAFERDARRYDGPLGLF
ncbi:MAG: hypothetical protein IJB75_03015 [Oscillospiraceae bacterium]|nr:hypothetical protein [Oscillospiraceae bacterium]